MKNVSACAYLCNCILNMQSLVLRQLSAVQAPWSWEATIQMGCCSWPDNWENIIHHAMK